MKLQLVFWFMVVTLAVCIIRQDYLDSREGYLPYIRILPTPGGITIIDDGTAIDAVGTIHLQWDEGGHTVSKPVDPNCTISIDANAWVIEDDDYPDDKITLGTPKWNRDIEEVTAMDPSYDDWTWSEPSYDGPVTDEIFIIEAIEPCAAITICLGDGRVELNWSDGPLTLIGDPNDYTEAAKVFLTEVMSDAAIGIVAADPNAIRELVKSGAVCGVVGHSWRGGRPGEGEGGMFADYHPDTIYRTCRMCGKCESRRTDNWSNREFTDPEFPVIDPNTYLDVITSSKEFNAFMSELYNPSL